MSYLGDFPVGQTVDHFFTTRRFTTGAPHALAGSPAIAAYEDNSTTEITAGITLTADFDARTGLNHVRIVATGGNGFEAGKSYHLVITAGTVDSVSVVGEVIGSFTLERSALADNVITAAKIAADAVTEIQAGLATAAALTTVDDFLDTEVAAIKAKTDQLTFTVANTLDANVEAVDGVTTHVDKLAAHLPTVLKAIIAAGSTTTSIVLNATTGINGAAPSATNDFYNSRVLVFTSGALAGQATSISDYVGATKTLTVVALTSAPAAADLAVIV